MIITQIKNSKVRNFSAAIHKKTHLHKLRLKSNKCAALSHKHTCIFSLYLSRRLIPQPQNTQRTHIDLYIHILYIRIRY